MLNNKEIGKNILLLRKHNGETQEELGKIINVTHNAVSYYEKGRRTVSHEVLMGIAKHYRVPIEIISCSLLSEDDFLKCSPNFMKSINRLYGTAIPSFGLDKENIANDRIKRGYYWLKRINGQNYYSEYSETIYKQALNELKSEKNNPEVAANILFLMINWWVRMFNKDYAKKCEEMINEGNIHVIENLLNKVPLEEKKIKVSISSNNESSINE
ncbi:MAG: helix-turn-helix domain-containing protein [Lachnospiraceae bacterium]|nr:helix-turn-helix domain-containing protein [Lachnospiraceae bacterium]